MTALGNNTNAATSTAPPRLMTRKRWIIIWLAFIGLSINYLDRSSLSVALPFMGKDFELSATQQGLIFAAFFWAYDFFQLADDKWGLIIADVRITNQDGKTVQSGKMELLLAFQPT